MLGIESVCADQFGTMRTQLLQVGISVSRLTLVTHNTADYWSIPNLRLDDWLVR